MGGNSSQPQNAGATAQQGVQPSGSDGGEMGGNSSQPKNGDATAQQGVQSSGQLHESSRSSQEELLEWLCSIRECRRLLLKLQLRSRFKFSESDGSEMGGNSSQPKNAGATAQQGVQSSGSDGGEMGGSSSQPKNAGATAQQGVQSSVQRHEPSRSSEEERLSLALSGFRRTRMRRLLEGNLSCSFMLSESDGSEMGGNSSQPKNAGATAQQGVQSSVHVTDGFLPSIRTTGHFVQSSSSSDGEEIDWLVRMFGLPKWKWRRILHFEGSDGSEMGGSSSQPQNAGTSDCTVFQFVEPVASTYVVSGSDGSEMGGSSSQPQNAGASAQPGVQPSGQQTGIILSGSSTEDRDLERSISSEAEESVVPPPRPLQCRTRRRRLSEEGLILSRQFAGADSSEMGGNSNQSQTASASTEQRIQSSIFRPDQLIDDWLVGPSKLYSAIRCIIYSWKKATTSAFSQWLKGMTTYLALEKAFLGDQSWTAESIKKLHRVTQGMARGIFIFIFSR